MTIDHWGSRGTLCLLPLPRFSLCRRENAIMMNGRHTVRHCRSTNTALAPRDRVHVQHLAAHGDVGYEAVRGPPADALCVQNRQQPGAYDVVPCVTMTSHGPRDILLTLMRMILWLSRTTGPWWLPGTDARCRSVRTSGVAVCPVLLIV